MELVTSESKETKRPRRRRRSQEEVLNLIRSSALQLFADRGYAGTTTQEIARRADVSETLLFRHFGDKAKLYDAVVSASFHTIIDKFVAERRQAAAHGSDDAEPYDESGELYDFFDQNREVFSALTLGATPVDGQDPVKLTGIESTFKVAAREIDAAFKGADADPPFDVDIAVRLTFGMIAASVLLRPLLFSASDATSEEVRDCIKAMTARSLWPN